MFDTVNIHTMKSITLIIRQSTKNVSASDILKVKQKLKKMFDQNVRIRTFANNDIYKVFYPAVPFVIIEITDINRNVCAKAVRVSSDMRHLLDFTVTWKSK